MVVGKGTKSKQKAKQSTGHKGTETCGSTSKKKVKDHKESPASSDEDTGDASPEAQARRTRSTLKTSEIYRH